MNRSELKIPLAIAGLAVLLSLAFSVAVFPNLREPLNLNIDPDRIGELGANIYEGRGLVYNERTSPALDRGPVYPYFLAAIFWLTGGLHFTAVQIFQAVCHGLTGVFIFLVAIRVFDRRIAIIAQLLCAVHPMLIWYTARIWIETVFTLAVVVVLYALVLFVERATLFRSLVAGIAIGIATLTKSILLLFPFLIGIVLIVHLKNRRMGYAVVLLLSFIIVVAPWTIRNYSVTGQFVPVHTLLGVNLIQGDAIGEYWASHPLSSMELWHYSAREVDSLLLKSGYSASDPRGDRILLLASFERNISDPLGFIKRVLINALTFWYLGESPLKSIFLGLIQFPLLLCMIVLFPPLWKKNVTVRVILLLIIYFVVTHSFVNGWARFSTPIVPASLLFISYAIVEVHRKLKSKLSVHPSGISNPTDSSPFLV